MLMSAVIDPDVILEKYFTKGGYSEQVKLFLRGIQSNGIILIDPTENIIKQLEKRILSLSIKYRQSILIYFEEILKNRKRILVKCKRSPGMFSTSLPLTLIAYNVKQKGNADCLFTTEDAINKYKDKFSRDNSIAPLSTYFDSKYEKMRFRLKDSLPSIDLLDVCDVEDIVIRITKYSKWLRIFDKQIGRGSNIGAFLKGIDFILKIWENNAYFNRQLEGVEIITCADEVIHQWETRYAKSEKDKRNRVKINRIMSDLIQPLRNKYKFSIQLKVIIDEERDIHARHLETQNSIVLIERGFDIFKSDGKFKRNILKMDYQSAPTLREYCKLPKYDWSIN